MANEISGVLKQGSRLGDLRIPSHDHHCALLHYDIYARAQSLRGAYKGNIKALSSAVILNSLYTMEEHEPGTSASTIRGLRHLDMSSVLNSTVTQDEHGEESVPSPYHPPSPLSTSQSEPDSPSGDSVSSLPSVSSSFLFSSGPASPPHIHQHSEQESELGDSTSGLIIPSLTLPSPSTRPTPYGQTLGELRLLVLGHNGADVNAVASDLVDENEDVVEVGPWEDDQPNGGLASLRVSTHWVEHRDAHGLERIEPARNVEIIKLPSYDAYSQVRLVSGLLMVV